MIKKIGLALALLCTAASLSACVVAAPGPGPGCYRVAGHYGPEGRWIPPHCR